jgi:hypothetical protein
MGAETCDPVNDCQPGNDPCLGSLCDENGDLCVACLVDADCDNGQFCDGAETCSAGICLAGTPPADPVLSNTTVVGPVTYQACDTLIVGPSVTISAGTVVLRAGTAVVFIDPVTVETGASLQVEQGPPSP